MAQAVSAPFQILGGFQKRAGLRSQAKAREYQAKVSDLRAAELASDRRQELNEAIGAIDVIRASRGLDPDSPTAQAIERRTKIESADAERREVLGERFRGVGLRTEARQFRSAGTAAAIGGIGQGLSSIAGFAIGSG